MNARSRRANPDSGLSKAVGNSTLLAGVARRRAWYRRPVERRAPGRSSTPLPQDLPDVRQPLVYTGRLAWPLGIIALVTGRADPLSWLVAGLALVLWILCRKRPTYWLFLLEAVMVMGLVARSLIAIVEASPRWWGHALGLFLLLSLLGRCLRLFAVFHARRGGPRADRGTP